MGSSDASAGPIHMLFFPLMSPGHMIPMVDMARLFATHGVRSTIVTTPLNAANIRLTVDSSAARGLPLSLRVIPFPDPAATGLAPGQENLSAVSTAHFNTFVMALFHFQAPLAALLRELRPDVLVSDSLFTWTADLALENGIPRLIFHGAGAFPLFVLSNLVNYLPVEPSTESFIMNGLPHPIRLYKNGLPELVDNLFMLKLLGEAEAKSYGVVVNTFHDMEPSYVNYYKNRNQAGIKAWCVGPISLCCRAAVERAERGESSADRGRLLAWLDSKPAGSVVYVCFGSLCHISGPQLKEIALGLEASGKAFLWVVRREAAEDAVVEAEWMPEGFEKRVEGRGLVVRGWAPQVEVLGHAAVGWFVTHCGWNSLQESVCAGVPMITWPLFHEQFINEALVVDVMGVGVRMWEGFRRNRLEEAKVLVTAEEVVAVVGRLVGGGGKEVEAVGRKAKEYGEAARKAVEEGGSTYEDVTSLIKELDAKRKEGQKDV
ncbi:UDP-glucose flavonoid 3-O-glucosyltransferase 7 [Cocos nucifera]|uniref:UDP-glucose flavonoid 3-O-glucosyltransferase 7 n=1 Tax=Cocos nucifera TaxID=13894 RepID=A0A8K0IAM4_COCNU|nr:UDP-glucose flavonoid 3-O-glucosyltransferase 7 [Cocos nucifera]